MSRLFGTDGVRGVANVGLTAELALDLAVAAAHVLSERAHGRRPSAVVGRDPRASGEFLEAAVVAGLASAGVDVIRLGVLPTPGVAFLTADLGADLGVMISASHNPMPDNGIKFFTRDGYKLPDAVEDEIAARLGEPWERPVGRGVGRVRDGGELIERYLDHLIAAAPHRLDGLRVVVDAAHGAASALSPRLLTRLGADVTAIASTPDGWNINDGVGSTHLGVLQEAVVAAGADVGIAHDGDADRCLAVDAEGRIVDGDPILAILALAMREAGELPGDTVVGTVMANLGLSVAFAEAGVTFVTTPVGDRYVLEAMLAGGHVLGGEQSGHVVATRYATTGDGLLTSVLLLGRMAATGRSLAELASVVATYPQVLRNVTVLDKVAALAAPAVQGAIAESEAQLAGHGRLLVRPSGTEALVRVMAEAPTLAMAELAVDRVVQALSAPR